METAMVVTSNGYGNGINGCLPTMETVMVVDGCWPAMDTAMELMFAGQHRRQSWWLVVAGQQ